MLEALVWVFHIIAILAFTLLFLNEFRRWKRPWMYKGETGPAGAPGKDAVCRCENKTENFYGSTYGHPDTYENEEDLYNLPLTFEEDDL